MVLQASRGQGLYENLISSEMGATKGVPSISGQVFGDKQGLAFCAKETLTAWEGPSASLEQDDAPRPDLQGHSQDR